MKYSMKANNNEREIAKERAVELIANVYEEMREKSYSEKEQIAILSQIKSILNNQL